MSAQRVLIFDSGVGGLSVYEQIIKLTPSIECHYLFDNAYFPYGELPHSQLVQRLTQLLTDFMQQHPADLIVIACNSASTIALDELRKHFLVPIVGVVPAIKPASLVTNNNVIGLLATPATIERVYTTSLINQFALGKTVLSIGSTALVKLAEDKLMGKAIALSDFKAVLAPWLGSDGNSEAVMPDTLVLGCTHFPLIKDELAACFTRPVHFVDSGEAIALRVQTLLSTKLIVDDCNGEEFGNHNAFYTKLFIDKAHFNSLSRSFGRYGFNRVSFFDC